MKAAYPVVMTEDSKYTVVYVPDFEINTQGISCVDAIEMARDAIGIAGITMIDDKNDLPKPSCISLVQENYPGKTVTLVDIDFDEYKRKNDTRSVKKNCTLPSWLCYEAEKAGINFSAVLQNALKKELRL